MINRNKLKGKMVEMDISVGAMSEKLNISPVTFYRKTIGESEFTQSEIKKIAEVLSLTMQEVKDIFFADELTGTQV